MEKYIPGIGICAGIYMLKWVEFKNYLNKQNFQYYSNDTINIYINFECIMKNLTLQKNLSTIVTLYKQNMVLEIESCVLNLIAHYKAYFKKDNIKTKIYLYYTSLKNFPQEMKIYNNQYRDYYKNLYTKNAAFKELGDILQSIIIKELKLILSYVPDCYFIESDMFDSSIIPYTISTFSDNKNIILSGDIFDSLYMFQGNFNTLYINRRFGNSLILISPDEIVYSIIKNKSPFELSIFSNELYYKLLLSIKGSKIRNIKSPRGFAIEKLLDCINYGKNNNILLNDFKSIDSIIEIFPDKYADNIKESFQCTDIVTQYNLMNDANIENIKNQIVDKFDMKSLEELNTRRFYDFPINLPMLI